ncbi:MAG: serine--tRNA ligase, partial [Nitrospinales bacterium]
MLDIKLIREQTETIRAKLSRRGEKYSGMLDALIKLDARRRELLSESETLKNKKKTLSAEVGKLKQQKKDAEKEMREVKTINGRIKTLDDETRSCEVEIQDTLLGIPNLPDDTVPDGADDSANTVERTWGD